MDFLNLLKEQFNHKVGIKEKRPGIYQLLAPTQFAQVIAKVSNMRMYKKEVIRSMFYELVKEFVETGLIKYKVQFNVTPIPDRQELEVDYLFENGKRPLSPVWSF